MRNLCALGSVVQLVSNSSIMRAVMSSISD